RKLNKSRVYHEGVKLLLRAGGILGSTGRNGPDGWHGWRCGRLVTRTRGRGACIGRLGIGLVCPRISIYGGWLLFLGLGNRRRLRRSGGGVHHGGIGDFGIRG